MESSEENIIFGDENIEVLKKFSEIINHNDDSHHYLKGYNLNNIFFSQKILI